MNPPWTIREARDDDALDVIELIGSVFGEYPNCVLDVDGELPELRRVASHYRELGGEFWVAERDLGGLGTRIVGMGGYSAKEDPAFGPGGIELRKLYVHRRERRSGLGRAFLERVEAAARGRGATFIDLWSDTRFTTAHAFYERRGYVRGPSTRELHDLSKSVEFYFKKALAPAR
jgi:putative acetyltransferase